MPVISQLTLLLAPAGQLSADGQLRELMAERRAHRHGDAGLWFLPASLLPHLNIKAPGQEAVAACDPQVITWLQLRFGGEARPTTLTAAQLQEWAAGLPPRPEATALA